MKAKLNFDFKAIQGFLLAHVEKIAFGAIALCSVLFLSGAVRTTEFDKTPQDLLDTEKNAKSRVENKEPQPQPPPPIESFDVYVEGMRIPINPDLYPLPNPMPPRIWDKQKKRTQPKILAVEELRAAPGRGSVSVKPSPANPTGAIGQRWVVVTGLIPYEQQFDMYEEAFKDCDYQNPVNDAPKIIYYNVERAERVSPNDASPPEWKTVNLNARLQEVIGPKGIWIPSRSEVVNPQYLHKSNIPIAFPLPPLGIGTFERNRSVAHHPEIPLAAEEMRLGDEDEAEDEADVPDGSVVPDIPDVPPGERVREMVEIVEVEPNPYQLLRFFDFHVESGKHYQYRVKLWLMNPNYNVPVQYLDQDELRKEQWLLSDWGASTEVVSVPLDTRILLGSVKPPSGGRVTSEPKATVGLPYFKSSDGVEFFQKYEVTRGKFLNYPGIKLSPEEMERPRRLPKDDTAEPIVVDFNSEAVLLDILGGEALPGSDRTLSRPGKLLMLDPFGNLIVRNELDDAVEFNVFSPPEDPAARRRDKERSRSEEDDYEEDGYMGDEDYDYDD